MRSYWPALPAVMLSVALVSPALADKSYGPGVSDTEIKIGQTMPYSGPASAYGTIGKAEAAYFTMINAQGGVNGRKITFISLDDGYSPPKTVEQTRRLVGAGQGPADLQPAGHAAQQRDPANTSTSKKVPQLFVATGATQMGRSRALPLDHGLAADLPDRRPHLRQIHPRP